MKRGGKNTRAFTLIETAIGLMIFSIAAAAFLAMYNQSARQAQAGLLAKVRQGNELAALAKLMAAVSGLNFETRVYADVPTAVAETSPVAVGPVVRFDRPDGHWFLLAYDAPNQTLNLINKDQSFTAPLTRAAEAFSADMGGGYLAVAVTIKGENIILKTDETF